MLWSTSASSVSTCARSVSLAAQAGRTIKFLWAPAVDHYRYHRRWMLAVDLAMGVLLYVDERVSVRRCGSHRRVHLLSATNDVAIDGYTIGSWIKMNWGWQQHPHRDGSRRHPCRGRDPRTQ
jgi:hypothetical protein